MMLSDNRVITWDLLKLLTIFFVVWGHCMQHLLDIKPVENPAFMWISSFHMPLFMALSGLFAKNTFSRPLKSYFYKRSRQLLLPWLSWSVILVLVITLMEGKQSGLAIISLFVNSLWFLKSLFICGLLALLAFKPAGNRIFWIILSFMISQILLIWNVFTMYPCFLFGILCSEKMGCISRHSKKITIACGLIFIITSITAASTPSFWLRDLGIRRMMMNGDISGSFILEVAVKRYMQVLLGCLGTLFFISLFQWIFSRKTSPQFRRFSVFGQYTLGVYVIQTVVVETLLPHWISISGKFQFHFDYLVAPVISIAVVFICLIINILIEKYGGVGTLLLFGRKSITRK